MDTLYIADCSPLQDEANLAAVLPYLDATRQQRIARLQLPEKRAQCAAAGLLLTRLFGQDDTPPTLFHGSRGKPYLYGRDDAFFSLSHSANWVVCATADNEIGVDAQVITPFNPKVAARCFTERERTWLAENPTERFTPLWTAKEAYIKFTGFGLVLPLGSFETPMPADGPDDANHCFWRQFKHENLFITLCCAKEWQGKLQIITL
ncbi:MAG: 4'-phosphopantetheinyl transferase superfamily protein [Clostridia bacterium]|nr:4'-phosphopantetheinyl transferase superfamily protein [Clostridia bacterium]